MIPETRSAEEMLVAQVRILHAAYVFSLLTTLALTILGLSARMGELSGPTLGWTAVGLGVVHLIPRLIVGNFTENRVYVFLATLIAVVIITLGVLGVKGTLSARQVGLGIIITVIPSILKSY